VQDKQFYIMGCPQADVENRTDLYDVFVNIPAAEIIVPSHAKGDDDLLKFSQFTSLMRLELSVASFNYILCRYSSYEKAS
jgi:hypothetical protein